MSLSICPLNCQLLDTACINTVFFFCHRLQVDVDTVWNELYTSAASRIAAGCVTDLALRVAQGELKVCLLTKSFIGN